MVNLVTYELNVGTYAEVPTFIPTDVLSGKLLAAVPQAEKSPLYTNGKFIVRIPPDWSFWVMNQSKTSFFLMAGIVVSLGIATGTFLWLKLAPRPPAWNAPALEGLNNYGAVPEFSLVERSGKNVTLADLRGKVWIADFIYTTCQDTCPMQSAAMTKLQEHWANKPNLRLVSFSVDPERDSPAVLSRYAERFKADAERWLFLTGDREQIAHLVQGGFRLSAAALTNGESAKTVIIHSPRFVLIDRKNEIRGYYDSRDNSALERLNKDVATLINGKGSS